MEYSSIRPPSHLLRRCCCSVVALSILMASGCYSGTPLTSTPEANLDTQGGTTVKSSPTATLTDLIANSLSSNGDITASYEQIEAEREQVIGHTNPPTKEQGARALEYDSALLGRRITGWQGWVQSVEPAKSEIDAYTGGHLLQFRLGVVMEKARIAAPRDNEAPQEYDIIIGNVPRSQVDRLAAWADISTPVWQEIRFSGTVFATNSTARLSLTLTDPEITLINAQGN